MSYEIHIVRGLQPDNSEQQISAAEWIAYIESDSGLQRVSNQNTNFVQAKLISASADESDGQVLTWSGGGISARYPKKSLLAKMSHIAKHFEANVISDDGETWTITEDGRVRVDSPLGAPDTNRPVPEEEEQLPRGIMWPYFNYDSETDPRRIIIWLLSCRSDSDITAAEGYLSDRLRIPLHEAAAALRTCQSGQPVGMPAPEDYEEACLLCERLQELGIANKGCGVRVSHKGRCP
jgi:hypothetical protein